MEENSIRNPTHIPGGIKQMIRDSKKVAIVYDRINKWGGAERVILALMKIFPNAPIYTSVYIKEKTPWAEDLDIRPSFIQKISPIRSRNEIILAPFMPIVFESFSFEQYDLVISVTSEASKGIITKPSTCHISYCLTPTRYLWSAYDIYFQNKLLRFFSSPIVSYLRKWDKIAANRPDYIISISREVQKRVKKYYGKESEVIYPPLSLIPKKKKKKENFFLLVSRLSLTGAYKRVDEAIDVFNDTGLSLKIVGTGSAFGKLRKVAKKNIEFLGEVSDDVLSDLYSQALALVFSSNEDFGLVVVEALGHGTPVLALNLGGAKETVIRGINGEFFDDRKSLSILLKSFDYKRYNENEIIESAQRFSEERFINRFETYINEKTQEYFSTL